MKNIFFYFEEAVLRWDKMLNILDLPSVGVRGRLKLAWYILLFWKGECPLKVQRKLFKEFKPQATSEWSLVRIWHVSKILFLSKQIFFTLTNILEFKQEFRKVIHFVWVKQANLCGYFWLYIGILLAVSKAMYRIYCIFEWIWSSFILVCTYTVTNFITKLSED